jgi:HAD superfamily hydrolase (TIGR01509 family)
MDRVEQNELLGPARHFLETRKVTEDETRQIDALAEALDPAPATREKCDSRFKSLPLGASDRDSFQRDRDHSCRGADPAGSAMKLPRMPAAVIFDMDGLLLDTETLYQEAILLAAAEGGHEIAGDIFNRTIGVPWAQSRVLLISHFGEAFPVDAFQEAWVRHFWVIAETRLELKPGALELLDTLDEMRLPRAIATSSSHRTVERHLTAHGLSGRFDVIVGHGDCENGKPAPDPFLKAAERLGIEPTLCLALEDSHNGVRSASAAGMMTLMVPDLLEPTEEIRGLCTLIVPNLHEVRHLIVGAT